MHSPESFTNTNYFGSESKPYTPTHTQEALSTYYSMKTFESFICPNELVALTHESPRCHSFFGCSTFPDKRSFAVWWYCNDHASRFLVTTECTLLSDPHDNLYRGSQCIRTHHSLTAKITIPAVKITGLDADAVATSTNEVDDAVVAPEDSIVLTPDPVESTTEDVAWSADMEDLLDVGLDPIDASLFPVSDVEDAAGLPDPEFGEFLLDAVDWL